MNLINISPTWKLKHGNIKCHVCKQPATRIPTTHKSIAWRKEYAVCDNHTPNIKPVAEDDFDITRFVH